MMQSLKEGDSSMKNFMDIVFIALYAYTTIFGLGPILFTDSSFELKVLACLLVISIYAVLTFFLLLWKRKNNKRLY